MHGYPLAPSVGKAVNKQAARKNRTGQYRETADSSRSYREQGGVRPRSKANGTLKIMIMMKMMGWL